MSWRDKYDDDITPEEEAEMFAEIYPEPGEDVIPLDIRDFSIRSVEHSGVILVSYDYDLC